MGASVPVSGTDAVLAGKKARSVQRAVQGLRTVAE
jgi:hypothetical protein